MVFLGMTRVEKYGLILGALGAERQIDICIEECAELIKALCKYKRKGAGDKETIENLRDEIADVLNMANQMEYIFGVDEIEKIVDAKLDRAISRYVKK